MTPEQVAMELRAKAQKATPGPWKHETQEGGFAGEREYTTGHVVSKAHNYAGNRVSRRDSVTGPDSMTFDDGEYIAACSPENVLALCDAYEALRREREWRDIATAPRGEIQACQGGALMPITPRQRDEIRDALTDEVLNRARAMSTTPAKREVIMAALRPLVREAGEGETKPLYCRAKYRRRLQCERPHGHEGAHQNGAQLWA